MRILLVEDDALLAKATARGLDHANFVVDIATTAEQAYNTKYKKNGRIIY